MYKTLQILNQKNKS